MKKLIALAGFLAFFASATTAQVQRDVTPSQSSPSNAEQKSKKKEMMKELNLTKEQRGQMKEFHHSMKEKKDNINNDQSLTADQKKEKMKELHEAQKEKLNTILTPEQKEKLRAQRKNSKMQPDASNKSLPPAGSTNK